MANMISSFFHPENGYKDAMKTSGQYYRDAQGRLQPIVNQGQDQYGRLMDQANRLNDPIGLENEWANAYTQSPEAKQDIANAGSAGLGAASSMGLNGSSAAIQNIQNSAGEIMNKDREGFLNRAMQKYMQSIGIGQNIYGLGANAAGGQSTNAMNEGNTMAGLQYGATAAPGQMFGDLLAKGAGAALNIAYPGAGTAFNFATGAAGK
jgi:hypothetical protein